MLLIFLVLDPGADLLDNLARRLCAQHLVLICARALGPVSLVFNCPNVDLLCNAFEICPDLGCLVTVLGPGLLELLPAVLQNLADVLAELSEGIFDLLPQYAGGICDERRIVHQSRLHVAELVQNLEHGGLHITSCTCQDPGQDLLMPRRPRYIYYNMLLLLLFVVVLFYGCCYCCYCCYCYVILFCYCCYLCFWCFSPLYLESGLINLLAACCSIM